MALRFIIINRKHKKITPDIIYSEKSNVGSEGERKAKQ